MAAQRELAEETGLVEADAEGITAARPIPWAEALSMVADGQIRDGETIAAAPGSRQDSASRP